MCKTKYLLSRFFRNDTEVYLLFLFYLCKLFLLHRENHLQKSYIRQYHKQAHHQISDFYNLSMTDFQHFSQTLHFPIFGYFSQFGLFHFSWQTDLFRTNVLHFVMSGGRFFILKYLSDYSIFSSSSFTMHCKNKTSTPAFFCFFQGLSKFRMGFYVWTTLFGA